MTFKRLPVDEPFAAAAQSPRSRPQAQAAASAAPSSRQARHRGLNREDGTLQLLISGAWTMLAGLMAGLLAATVFGGVGRQGAHSNAGWLSLMIAMMSTPFGILLLLLGVAKWLRNCRLSKGVPRSQRD